MLFQEAILDGDEWSQCASQFQSHGTIRLEISLLR